MSMQDLISRYEAGPATLRKSLSGLTESELAYKYDPTKWSIKEIAIHVADMDEVLAFRMKRIVAEESPKYPGVDQDFWAAGLGYQQRQVEPALRMLEAVRAEMAIVLKSLPEAAWSRKGYHDAGGEQPLSAVFEHCTEHLEIHIGQIEAIRARLGK